jgi:hypothetical protein
MNLKDLIKVAAPVAIGSFAPALMPGMNPLMSRALASGAGSLIMGGKPKDALLAGALGAGLGAIFPGQKPGPEQLSGSTYDAGPMQVADMAKKTGLSPADAAQKIAKDAAKNIATTTDPIAADTMSASLLQKMGMNEDSMLFKFMNSKLGEGVAAGVLAQLLSEDEEAPQSEFERRAFGEGGPGGRIGGMPLQYAGGGEAYFPRRNGGIDPSEGSGTKDDVPALLMAGEFVMTRDAVKGMGGGNLRKGIGRMYDMMDNLERTA